jgi:hypothetical protein
MTDKEITQLSAALDKLRAGDLSSVKSDLAEVRNSQSWHKTIGWWAIGLAGVAAVALFGLALITNSCTDQDGDREGHGELQTRHEGRESLAAMKATLDLMRQDAQKKVADLMKENLKDQDADLGLRTVGALAEKARQSEIVGDPSQLVPVGEIALHSGQIDPKIANVAFDAISHLASYRSFLNRFHSPSTASATEPDPGDFSFYFKPENKSEGKIGHILVLGGAVPFEAGARGELIGYPTPQYKTAPGFYVVARSLLPRSFKHRRPGSQRFPSLNFVLRSLCSPFRGDDIVDRQHRRNHTAVVGFYAVLPSLLNLKDCDAPHDIHANRFHSNLINEVGIRKVVDCDLMTRRAESPKHFQDAIGVFLRGLNPDVKILRVVGLRVLHHCLPAHYEKPYAPVV